MQPAQQLAFPFSSLDFEGHTVLRVDDIATKFRWTPKHVLNLIEQGELVAIDGKSKGVNRRNCRIPLEAYHTFIVGRMTGEHRTAFLRSLPRPLLVELRREIGDALNALTLA